MIVTKLGLIEQPRGRKQKIALTAGDALPCFLPCSFLMQHHFILLPHEACVSSHAKEGGKANADCSLLLVRNLEAELSGSEEACRLPSPWEMEGWQNVP